ncbi:L-type lectin-domain containing protein [Paractinoplanes atraurantiacus]|uniref:Legume lectin domain-containing protein n=1 Tax=Paractinoplanes atraurantiacus TaxID=1036182 RepID=A0A285ILC2_9ACTN|nr:L-type lectin-domain containing protein [Actinoplanes atraurantiacus]SNY47771.1 Legume lectin domain-containing protein [Actinoplanes atraurantiacus]
MSQPVHRKRVTAGLLAAAASVAAVAAAAPAQAATGGFPFSDYSLNGSAAFVSASDSPSSVLRLTGGGYRQAGSAWGGEQIDLTRSFETSFGVHLRGNAPGADGVAFLVQAVGPRALGGWGGGLGYRGIRQSVAVELDDFRNPGDADASHAGVVLRGNPDYHLAAAPTGTPLFGAPVTVRVAYDAGAHNLTVHLGGRQLISTTVDLAAQVGADRAWAGFTGATGSTTSTQEILDWSLSVG